MREDELHRQVAELVADHADRPRRRRSPPSAAGGAGAVSALPRVPCC